MLKRTLILAAFLALTMSMSADLSPLIRCTAESNGIAFQRENASEAIAAQEAVGACVADSRTIVTECQTKVSCGAIPGPHHPSPVPIPSPTPSPAPSPSPEPQPDPVSPVSVSCVTTSAGTSFRVEGGDSASVGAEAVAECKADPASKPEECDANLSCGN